MLSFYLLGSSLRSFCAQLVTTRFQKIILKKICCDPCSVFFRISLVINVSYLCRIGRRLRSGQRAARVLQQRNARRLCLCGRRAESSVRPRLRMVSPQHGM